MRLKLMQLLSGNSSRIDSDAMALKNQAANVTLAEFGTTVTVGRADALNQNVFIDSDSIDIRRGTQVSASFGATTTIATYIKCSHFY